LRAAANSQGAVGRLALDELLLAAAARYHRRKVLVSYL
jgi:hypothetical protein